MKQRSKRSANGVAPLIAAAMVAQPAMAEVAVHPQDASPSTSL